MDAPADIAERCRRKADKCRQMAQRARDPKIKAELLDLAAQRLALAEDAERRRYCRSWNDAFTAPLLRLR